MANGFTGKQQKFIDAYLGEANFNATKAAKLAGYKGNGNTVAVIGYDNLRKHNIAHEIKIRLQAEAMGKDELLKILGNKARGEKVIAKYLTSDGVNVEAMLKDGYGNLIKSMKPGKYGMIIEFVDSLESQRLIGKHLALFIEKSEVVEIDGGSLVDFEEWKKEQGDRENKASETLEQFDE